MLGSRVCWQLFLGWALLLGQPVFGDSDAAEELPLAESEELVPIAEEPEEPVPASQEPDEPVPESQELDEPVPESEEWENKIERLLNSYEMEMAFGPQPSDEELEKIAEQSRRRVERGHGNYYMALWKQMAVQHYNQKSNHIYTLYDKGNVKVKKAIGTEIYITLLLVKTSCTKEEGEAIVKQLLYDSDEMVHNPLPTVRKHCKVPPRPEQEILECTFTLFQDARHNYWHRSIIHHSCVPFTERRESNS